jgi:hypothetical protein
MVVAQEALAAEEKTTAKRAKPDVKQEWNEVFAAHADLR